MRSRCRSRKHKKILDLIVQELSGCFLSRTFFGLYMFIERESGYARLKVSRETLRTIDSFLEQSKSIQSIKSM